MSKKVFVYLPEKEMEALGVDPAPYKEKLHQVAESLYGELLTDVVIIKEENLTCIDQYIGFLRACNAADVIITIDTYSIFSEGAKQRSWRVSADMLYDIHANSDKKVFVIDSSNLFTQKELNELYNRRYKDQETGRAACTCTPVQCGTGEIKEV